ncbi:terminase small subunit [Lactobacillus panisapium]|uniref:terminase small subunit n=1 Tax=Lactobacillus panisapium TaxID=2012495 RepID=UPI001C6A60D3|nr:terminase small subunit [Lactobacillus panisapium]QYN54533.1 terminase small subunit [Lactobacillus panisapium]
MKEEEIKTVIVNTIKDSLNRPKPYLNRREIAKYFGVADSTITYWASIGMPVSVVDGRKLYGKESITNWLKSKEQTKKPVTNQQ